MTESFYDGYVEAMNFTDVHPDNPKLHAAEGFSNKLLEQMKKDCDKFEVDNADALAEYYATCLDAGESRAGCDFWLTRNNHGAGFWSRRLPCDLGDRLTKAAKAFRSVDLYVGDDNMIYGS